MGVELRLDGYFELFYRCFGCAAWLGLLPSAGHLFYGTFLVVHFFLRVGILRGEDAG